MMTMTGGEDRLSAFGNDILRRILYFAPSKEAASTSVLSRRWRHLWRSSGAINLAVRVPDDGSRGCSFSMGVRQSRHDAESAFFSHCDAFVRAADSALAGAAASGGVTRLTLNVEGDRGDEIQRFLHHGDVVGRVVAHPAARHMEEFRIAVVESLGDKLCIFQSETSSRIRQGYTLPALPSSETLRVLDLTKCVSLSPQAGSFPRLTTLRLRLCTLNPKSLQSLIDAAPELTTVHFDSVYFKALNFQQYYYNYGRQQRDHNATTQEPAVLRLRFPAATEIVLLLCSLDVRDGKIRWALEIDAPRLRSFRYKGLARQFKLSSPAPDMAHTDLHLLPERKTQQDTTRVLFWNFVRNFTNARALKLKVNYLKDIAAIGRARQAELLCPFPNVQRLHLEGVHDPRSKTAAVAIANLLHCCPVLTDLRLKLSTVSSDSLKRSRYGLAFLERKERSDYEKSVRGFMHRKSNKPVISLEDESRVDKFDKVSDIPGLTGRSFACLQSSLRRVSLQFRLGTSSCLGVRLVKFFTDNAVNLEEICVDSGNRKLSEHVNLNVERWVAPKNSLKASRKRKNLEESSWEFSEILRKSMDSTTHVTMNSTGFRVLPLRR